MRTKADKAAYKNKAERFDSPKRVLIEVVKPHDGLMKGYQAYKPEKAAKKMIELGYWKEVKENKDGIYEVSTRE